MTFIVSKFCRTAQRPPSPENPQWVRKGTRKQTDEKTGLAADRPVESSKIPALSESVPQPSAHALLPPTRS